jgi:hypothetical protein
MLTKTYSFQQEWYELNFIDVYNWQYFCYFINGYFVRRAILDIAFLHIQSGLLFTEQTPLNLADDIKF